LRARRSTGLTFDATITEAEKPAVQALQKPLSTLSSNSISIPSFPLLPSVQILFYPSVIS
jgi:hypothetical protein